MTNHQIAGSMMVRLFRGKDGRLPADLREGYPLHYVLVNGTKICPACANGENGSKASETTDDESCADLWPRIKPGWARLRLLRCLVRIGLAAVLSRDGGGIVTVHVWWRDVKGFIREGTLTTEHELAGEGLPVLLDQDGVVLSPEDMEGIEIHRVGTSGPTAEIRDAARRAGYKVVKR